MLYLIIKYLSRVKKNQNKFNFLLDVAPFSGNVAIYHTFHEIRSKSMMRGERFISDMLLKYILKMLFIFSFCYMFLGIASTSS